MCTAPSAPRDLISIRLTSTSVMLKWTQPEFPNGIIRSYTVVYQKAVTGGSSSSYNVITVEAKSLSVILTDLEQSVDYIVWVRVRDTVSSVMRGHYLIKNLGLRCDNFSVSV